MGCHHFHRAGGIRRLVVKHREQLLMLQRQNARNQFDDPARGPGVAEVALGGGDRHGRLS